MRLTKYLILFFIFLPMVSFGQVIIEMENDGGVYKVPCKINGQKYKLIFDTGASSVSISSSVANIMLENGFLSKSDIIGGGQTRIADGKIIDHTRIVLRTIEIGGRVLNNIEAIVMPNSSAPLLLGQSAIRKLGKISITGNKLIIHSSNTPQNFTSSQDINFEAEKRLSLGLLMGGKGYRTNDGNFFSLCAFTDNSGEFKLLLELFYKSGYSSSSKPSWFSVDVNFPIVGAFKEELKKIYNKCVEWDDVAKENSIDDFRKKLPFGVPYSKMYCADILCPPDYSEIECNYSYKINRGSLIILSFTLVSYHPTRLVLAELRLAPNELRQLINDIDILISEARNKEIESNRVNNLFK